MTGGILDDELGHYISRWHLPFEHGNRTIMKSTTMIEKVQPALLLIILDDMCARRALNRSPTGDKRLTMPRTARVEVGERQILGSRPALIPDGSEALVTRLTVTHIEKILPCEL